MQLPSVLIAANPYEGELCRKALADTGLEVEMAESIEGALRQIAARTPLVVVIADGWYPADARELLVEVRASYEQLPIFLVEDRGRDIADEATAVRRGATRLFFRPIEVQALADAVERLAVEAERRLEPDTRDTRMPESRSSSGNGHGNGHSREGMGELLSLRRPSQVPSEVTPVDRPPARANTEVIPISQEGALLRADALVDAVSLQSPPLGATLEAGEAGEVKITRPLSTDSIDRLDEFERSTVVQQLDDQLSQAERRLFPDAAPTPSRPGSRYAEVDDPLGDIDLDALGLDTQPGISLDRADAQIGMVSSQRGTDPARRLTVQGGGSRPNLTGSDSAATTTSHRGLPEEGSLGDHDVAELIAGLHLAGWSGRLVFEREDGEKDIYFDQGQPVFASSTFLQDRLGDLLYREGKLTREQQTQARALLEPFGRRAAIQLMESGLLKGSELYPVLRHQVEEVCYSIFAWDHGRYRQGAEQVPAEDRLRLTVHPWALVCEGIRRKYGLERLIEQVGPSDTVLRPTQRFERALVDCALSPGERAAAQLFDGVRTLAEVRAALGRFSDRALSETSLYAFSWALLVLGGVELSSGDSHIVSRGPSAGGPTMHSETGESSAHESQIRERRRDRRAPTDLPADRTIERERLLAKQAQLGDCNYFTALGVSPEATAHEIDRAYQRAASDFSPDRFHPEVRAELGEALEEIREILKEAHRVLMDDRVRAAYRANLTSVAGSASLPGR